MNEELTISVDRLLLNSEDKTILDIRNLNLPSKGMVLLCGQSGAGKSLLLKCILGLVRGEKWGSEIEISKDGKDIHKVVSEVPIIGYIPQDIRQSFDQNKSIEYHIKEASLGKVLSQEELNKSLSEFDLPIELLKRYPHQCSGGQLQRILVLIADLHKPKIILADEAISALDPENETNILQYLKEKVRERNCLVIAISHRFELPFYDHVIYLKNGEIALNKSVNELTKIEKEMIPSTTFVSSNNGFKKDKLLLKLIDVILPYQNNKNYKINFEFYKGTSYGVYGKSGTGKTTLLKCISGLLPLASGKLGWSIADQRIQMVFQHPATGFNPKHTIKDYFAEYTQIFKKEYEISISTLMNEMKLDEAILERFPAQLSGGELQRISIIRALACKPAIVLFDEAFASIDQTNAINIQSIIEKFQKQDLITFVYVSHDLDFLKNVCQELIML
jgi:ABC-type dipeptide/oligopeptide/nickel transport system ATPase subunit